MTSELLHQSFSQSFQQYDELLTRYRDYWQFNPFACEHWPWSQSAHAITTLIDAELANLPQPVPVLSIDSAALPVPPFWLTNGIQGRKLAQIKGFIAQFDSHQPVLEWCAGKGHLGRLLSAQRELQVTSLEWQASLCQQGQELARQFKVAQQFQHSDVMALPLASLPNNHAMIALHACGDLHRRLLEQFVQSPGAELFLAPCCYHLQADSRYIPMSAAARQSSLCLSKRDLKLAVQEFVTAGQRTARLRDTEQLWRLLFQLYRAQVSGDTAYRALPTSSKQIFTTDVGQFMRWACQQQVLPEPSVALVDALLPLAHQRLQLVRSLDQVRQLFRRPLELWLLLDRAMFLSERGYQVELRQFCHYHDSPRNTLIIAKH